MTKEKNRTENWNLRCMVFLSSKILLSIFLFRVFGHISYRSDWELVKVDFRPSFPRECTDDDYESWDLTNLQVFMVLCYLLQLFHSFQIHVKLCARKMFSNRIWMLHLQLSSPYVGICWYYSSLKWRRGLCPCGCVIHALGKAEVYLVVCRNNRWSSCLLKHIP